MNSDELIEKIDAWAFDERSADFTSAAGFEYRAGFRDACDLVRGLISTNREPVAWLGGHCKYPNHKHTDCPGRRGRDEPCVCSCHKSHDSETGESA